MDYGLLSGRDENKDVCLRLSNPLYVHVILIPDRKIYLYRWINRLSSQLADIKKFSKITLNIFFERNI